VEYRQVAALGYSLGIPGSSGQDAVLGEPVRQTLKAQVVDHEASCYQGSSVDHVGVPLTAAAGVGSQLASSTIFMSGSLRESLQRQEEEGLQQNQLPSHYDVSGSQVPAVSVSPVSSLSGCEKEEKEEREDCVGNIGVEETVLQEFVSCNASVRPSLVAEGTSQDIASCGVLSHGSLSGISQELYEGLRVEKDDGASDSSSGQFQVRRPAEGSHYS